MSNLMGDKTVGCPPNITTCDAKFCHNRGICCIESSTKREFCACFEGFTGTLCQRRIRNIANSVAELHRTELIAAFSAILGVVVILLFVALIFLQVKYYRQRKKRREEGEHEMDRNPKSEECPLRNEPGYSWRESARRPSSKAYQKLKGPLSKSVPEDLFKMGLNIALLGMKGDEERQNNEKRSNADALGRCFSADASSGGGGGGGETFRYSKLQETEKNDDDKGKEKTISDQKTEDMVG